MNYTFCIIGGGVSGIACIKHCIEQDYKSILLEKNEKLGGVWYNNSYPGVQLQTTKNSYCYSDFSFDDKIKLYPDRDEIMDYIENYLNKFNLKKYCKCNSNVIKTEFKNDNWIITYIDNKKNKIIIKSKFLIIASGFYSEKNNLFSNNSKKYILNNKNILLAEDFNYKNNKSLKIFENKNIVILGNGPTGCDLSVLAYKNKAKSVTLLYRSNRWIFKRYLKNKSTDWALCRFIINIANKIENLNIVFNKIILIFLIFLYLLIYNKFKFNILPPLKFIDRNNVTVNDEIFQLINTKKINYIKTNNICISKKKIIFDDINIINYDYLINATGYNVKFKFLNLNNIPYLYKNIVHPFFKNCAFIGFVSSFNWIQVSELQIIWYLNYIKNQLNQKYLIDYINKKKNNNNNRDFNDYAIKSYEYCDDLAKDLNIKIKYNKYQYSYWFKSPEYNLWSKYN